MITKIEGAREGRLSQGAESPKVPPRNSGRHGQRKLRKTRLIKVLNSLKEVRVYVKVKTPIRSGTRHSWPAKWVHGFKMEEDNIDSFCRDLSEFIHLHYATKPTNIK